MRFRLMLSLTVLTLTAVSANGRDDLRIAVSPVHSFAPTNLRISARVPRNPDNRMLRIIAESEGFYRSSEVSLEGEQAPAVMTFEFRAVPGGEYAISGVLIDSAGNSRAIDQRSAIVIAQ